MQQWWNALLNGKLQKFKYYTFSSLGKRVICMQTVLMCWGYILYLLCNLLYLICICCILYVFVISYVYLLYLMCICCTFMCICCIYVYMLYSYVYLLYYVCIDILTLDAGLLARSKYPEGPATGHLDTDFSWFPCVYKRMLRWFPSFHVATTCFSCSPPHLNFLVTFFHIFLHVK